MVGILKFRAVFALSTHYPTFRLLKFRKAVTDCGVSFGANGYSPFGALICGQDYEKSYVETCDFLQPLLCYMEWHRYMPIAAWARYIQQFSRVDEQIAIEAAQNLFFLSGTICPKNLKELGKRQIGGRLPTEALSGVQ
jgi:hypothetical protein